MNEIQIPDPSELTPERGKLFVISGPSGVGKGTIIQRMLNSTYAPKSLVRCVTATTRAPREGEKNGINYHFFSHEDFKLKAEQGFFLEYALYNDNLYGTPYSSVERELNSGHDVLLEIEVQGGLTILEKKLGAVLVFLWPPTYEELERRLRSRATESAEVVERRLSIARREMQAAVHYDYLVVNDEVDSAVDQVRSIIIAERRKIEK